MDMFEEAQALYGMIQMLGLTQDEVARKLGVSQSYIANKLRLLKFSPRVREKIREGNLSERHARALLRLSLEEDILFLIEKIREDALTVQSTEEIVEAHLALFAGGGMADVVALIERVVHSYTETVHNKGFKIRKVVEEGDGEMTLTFTLQAI